LGLAVAWIGWVATSEEAEKFAPRLVLSFVYLVIGFAFFNTGFPERFFKDSRFV
jgi:hypothetical protein